MKTNKTNQLHFIFLLAVLGSTLEFWWPIIALYVAKMKIKCTVRCSIRYSACKWKALPFFLQDLQFPSAWDFLWGTANPAAKEACCFHWFFVSQKLVFSDTRVRRILLLCLLDEENTLSAKLVQVCKVCISLPLFYPSSQSQPKFYIIATVHPVWCFLFKVRNMYRLGGSIGKKKQQMLFCCPCEMSLCFVGVMSAELQVHRAPSLHPWPETGGCSFSVSLRRGLWWGCRDVAG